MPKLSSTERDSSRAGRARTHRRSTAEPTKLLLLLLQSALDIPVPQPLIITTTYP